jgi:predicted nucleic acid-binding protein
VWADAWLLAVAEAAGGVLVTFDKALAARGAHCLLAKRG